MKKPRAEGAQPNKSLIDGIVTLQALAMSAEPVGCRELARRLGFEHTRTNRLLKTLAYLGIAQQTPDRRYTAGPGMHILAAQSLFASGLLARAVPVLERLNHFGHTVALGVLWRTSVSYLFHRPPGVSSADAIGRIGLYPASKGGIGLTLLAELPPEDVAESYETEEVADFESTEDLQAFLDEARAQGYVRRQVKKDPDHHTISIALGNQTSAAIGLSGYIPTSQTDSIVETLQAARRDILESTGDESSSIINVSHTLSQRGAV